MQILWIQDDIRLIFLRWRVGLRLVEGGAKWQFVLRHVTCSCDGVFWIQSRVDNRADPPDV